MTVPLDSEESGWGAEGDLGQMDVELHLDHISLVILSDQLDQTA